MLAVVRVRGSVGVKGDIKSTLRMLHLEKKNRCIVIPETPQYLGMVEKAKDYVTWGPVSGEILAELLKKRARTEKNEKLTDVKGVLKKVNEGKIKEAGIKPYFRLSPPSKGFKGSIKQHYPKGALGDRGDRINELLKRMI